MNFKTQVSGPLLWATASLMLMACGGSDTQGPSPVVAALMLQPNYQEMLEKTVAAGVPGAVLYISSPGYTFYGAAGLADLDSHAPMTIDARMPLGSAGKKFTALLAAMLHEDGKLNLDAPLSDYLAPDVLARIPHSSQMSTRQLLNHSAGLFDYVNQSEGAYHAALLSDPTQLKTDSFALPFLLDQPANFAPGAQWSYSNSGYILTGLVLDKVLKQHHAKTMRSYILNPLGLHSMSYGGVETQHGALVSGYYRTPDGKLMNTKTIYQNIGMADAPVVGSARDMAELLRIIVEASHISVAQREHLIGESRLKATGSPGLWYGAGIFKELKAGKVMYHHGGREVGYATFNMYFPRSKTAVAALFNCSGYAECEQAFENTMEKVTAAQLSKF